MRTILTLILAASLFLGCSKEDDPPPPPPPGPVVQPPPPLNPGEGRLYPQSDAVVTDETFIVYLDVSSGTETLGALSARVNFNRDAFELVSLVGTDSTLGAPYYQVENTSGSIYVSWTNTIPATADLTGERRIAMLTFRALGGSGVKLNLNGTLKAMGDTAFPAQDIGTTSFPRPLDIVTEVEVKSS
jgi:hypothetical protein